jgi:hypothetical protein
MAKTSQFGEVALEEAWNQIKQTIQHPHLYPTVKKSTIRQADAWASAKWGRAMDYINIIRYLGVEVIED